jgi:hypothetical protein
MSRRRAIVGVAVLCAFAACAFAVPSAFAQGTTAFTCKQGAGLLDFTDEHCTSGAVPGTGKWGHQEIAAGKATEFTATNEKTTEGTKGSSEATVSATIKATKVHITCSLTHWEGTLTNEIGPPMKTNITNLKTTVSGCTIKEPATECTVAKKEIKFEPLIGTSQVETMSLQFTPKEGTTLAVITIEGCTLAGSYKLTGTLGGTPEGATVSMTEASSKIELAGSKAVLTNKVTPRMKEEPFQETNPIVYTTTAT